VTGPAPDQGRRAHGAFGEGRVAQWYEARGYRVLARNWRSRTGELDLVVGQGRVVVFCEVKARSTTAFGSPFEAVTPAKQARLRKLAAEWLAEAGPAAGSRELRFDVAAVLSGKVEVIEAAF
jgi:putative endonuclease